MLPDTNTHTTSAGNLFRGLFVGMVTVDILYRVERPPGVNEKLNAHEQLVLSGGPAANAALTFSALGGESTLAAGVGLHPLGRLIYTEMERYRVRLLDLAPEREEPPPLSSIMIKDATGERSVISIDASRFQATAFPAPELPGNVDILLVDGHQMHASLQACDRAHARGVPCVLDGGSWKENMADLLAYIDYAICSADFMPPGCRTHQEVVDYLQNLGMGNIAITRGAEPLIYSANGKAAHLPVPQTEVIDTLGAGDIFHGAFCYFILVSKGNFQEALSKAARVASLSCQTFGTRRWIRDSRLREILGS